MSDHEHPPEDMRPCPACGLAGKLLICERDMLMQRCQELQAERDRYRDSAARCEAAAELARTQARADYDRALRAEARTVELSSHLANARRTALEQAAHLMNPCLRTMLSRTEAVRLIRELMERHDG